VAISHLSGAENEETRADFYCTLAAFAGTSPFYVAPPHAFAQSHLAAAARCGAWTGELEKVQRIPPVSLRSRVGMTSLLVSGLVSGDFDVFFTCFILLGFMSWSILKLPGVLLKNAATDR